MPLDSRPRSCFGLVLFSDKFLVFVQERLRYLSPFAPRKGVLSRSSRRHCCLEEFFLVTHNEESGINAALFHSKWPSDSSLSLSREIARINRAERSAANCSTTNSKPQ